MSHAALTTRLIETLKPGVKPYFVRDTKCKGFGVKVNPSGLVKYYAEAKYLGRTNRKTLGESSLLSLDQAKLEAIRYLSKLKSGRLS